MQCKGSMEHAQYENAVYLKQNIFDQGFGCWHGFSFPLYSLKFEAPYPGPFSYFPSDTPPSPSSCQHCYYPWIKIAKSCVDIQE